MASAFGRLGVTFLQAILFIVVVIMLLIFGPFMYRESAKMWRAIKHPYHNRILTSEEEQFLVNAQQDLREFTAKESAVPRIYLKLFLFSYLPAMVIAWGVLYGIWYGLLQFVHWPLMNKIKNGDVLFFDYDVGISALIAVFLGIVLAGYGLYWITVGNRNLHIAMLLNGASDQNEDKGKILARQMDGIEDALRLKKISPTESFSSEDYLYDTSLRHRRAFGFMTLPLLVVTVFFGFFDLRQTTIFYPDRLTYKRYWSGEQRVIDYDYISDVRISCNLIRTRGRSLSTRITFNSITGASYKALHLGWGSRTKYLDGFNSNRATVVNGAARLDNILREKNLPFETVSKNQYCFEEFVTRSRAEHRDQLRKILHMPAVSKDLEGEN